MTETDVTIVVVPRERFSRSERSLEALYEHTEPPFRLIYVDGRSPRRIARYLRRAAWDKGFTLLRSERYLSPNEARNHAMRYVTTPYVVFIDNDILVRPGWLERMVACAQETAAWVVGPLYLEGDPADEIIHMAGGDMELSGEPGRRQLSTMHRLQGVRLGSTPHPLGREACDYIEFHCALVRTDALEAVGAFDPRLLSSREHLDFCLRIHEAGGTVWFEPAAIVSYVTPPPFALSDIPYFWLRWSESWASASLEHFCAKYGVDESYKSRIAIMRARRQKVFEPVRGFTERWFGRTASRNVDRLMRHTERRINALVFRVGHGPSASDPSHRVHG